MHPQSHPPSKNALPDDFRPFFWSYLFENLDRQKDEKTIILQLVNYGSLTHWRWLAREYGVERIGQVLQSLPVTEIKPRTRPLASLLFSIPTFSHVQRGTY
jgi:hypothetical protein